MPRARRFLPEASHLAAQLRGVLDSLATNSQEAARLAGLLERHDPAAEILHPARQLRTAGVLRPCSHREVEDLAVALLAEVRSAETSREARDTAEALLFAIDERCAGLCFLAHGVPCLPIEDTLGPVLAAIRGTPAAWHRLSPLAAEILARAQPLRGDAAGALWHALALCRQAQALGTEQRAGEAA
jgi:hypothetical protein